MKLPFRPLKKKKLQAATVRRAREADYTEEPNVKLSSAFIVVLVLHVVAVGGIYAFNAIKAHQPPAFDEADSPAPPAQIIASTQTTDTPASDVKAATTPAPALTYRVKSGDTVAKIATAYGVSAPDVIDLNHLREMGGIHVGEELKLPAGAALSADQTETSRVTGARDSGSTYTVVHGDTPVSIARKLHVVYDDLIQLNKIEDPKKLKIGIKLKVPIKRIAAA
jgi:LysM repeat protein